MIWRKVTIANEMTDDVRKGRWKAIIFKLDFRRPGTELVEHLFRSNKCHGMEEEVGSSLP